MNRPFQTLFIRLRTAPSCGAGPLACPGRNAKVASARFRPAVKPKDVGRIIPAKPKRANIWAKQNIFLGPRVALGRSPGAGPWGFICFCLFLVGTQARAQTEPAMTDAIFDDQRLLNGYQQKYQKEPLSILLAMMRDDALNPLKATAGINVFIEQYSDQLLSRDKAVAEKTLLRRLNRTDSPFVQVAAMHALCRIDRYQYFKPLVPALILKIDHYDRTVSAQAAAAVDDILAKGSDKAWEARIVFNTLRKVFFLSRNKLTGKENPALQSKVKILRWAIKILGSQELNALPKEVIPLL